MTLKEFIKTKTFKVNALAAVGITLFLIGFIMIFLRIYTNHGDSVEIPDLKGKSTQEVANLLELNDLRFEIKDSVYSAETAPGTVLDQYPKPGMKVKQNRIVFLTLCALNQEMIPMPQLTDISYRQATNLIENSGLVAGNIQYKLSEFLNLVLEQRVNGRIVAKGEMVPKGSRVDLVLGSDSDGLTIAVPQLTGHTLSDAQVMIEESFLSIGTVNYDESITSEEQKAQGVIYKQSPDPAEVFEITRGTSIDVWLTVDPAKVQQEPDTVQPENSFF
ncbi:MAG: PASTA domain-containing protein [Verrucomicrobia bacterium]|nr:PASTA domain-containing protein [Prolixibacteraceae bacterium]